MIREEEKEALNTLLTRLIKKGQPLAHIYAEHADMQAQMRLLNMRSIPPDEVHLKPDPLLK